MLIESLFLEGAAFHQAGLLEPAENCYRAVLAEQPEHSGALHYLGLVAFQRGQFDVAVAHISRAVELSPPPPAEYHVNLGNALKRAGYLDRALGSYEIAVQLRPDLSVAWFNLGLLKRTVNDLPGAISALEAACRPPSPLIEAWVELAECHADQGDDRAALLCFDQVLPRLSAKHAPATLIDLAIRVGRSLVGLGRYAPAANLLERYRTVRADDVDYLNTLGCAQSGLGRISDAERNFAHAHVVSPENIAALDNLASVLKDSGRNEESLALYRQMLNLPCDNGNVWSNYLFTLLYSDAMPPEFLLAEHRRASAAMTPSDIALPLSASPVSTPNQPLRLGYLSGDFRNHPVAYFIAGIFRHHDPARVELHVYDNSPVTDVWTERLKALVTRWHAVRRLSDHQLAEQIRQDGIDVLIDLSGHTADNRLAALAWRPAKVQAAYLGYSFSTGMPWIDWRIVDWVTDPPGSEGLSSERLLRLPCGYYAYSMPEEAAQPGELPMLKNGYLTFGVCSNLAKVSLSTLDIWAAILRSFPQARLFWRTKAFVDPIIQHRMTEALKIRGVDRKRLTLVAWASHAERWQAFRKIDVALDTYPYSQATNTCEALWMGVPTISVSGTAHFSRMGASILDSAGLGDWVFEIGDIHSTAGEGGKRLQGLCSTNHLSILRKSLRERLLTSGLMNSRTTAHAIEEACYHMLSDAAIVGKKTTGE